MKLGFFFSIIFVSMACGAPQEPAICENDNDCLGERICINDACTEPNPSCDNARLEYQGQSLTNGGLVNPAALDALTVTDCPPGCDCAVVVNETTATISYCAIPNNIGSEDRAASVTFQAATVQLTASSEDLADDGAIGPSPGHVIDVLPNFASDDCVASDDVEEGGFVFFGDYRSTGQLGFAVNANVALGIHTLSVTCTGPVGGVVSNDLVVTVLFNANPMVPEQNSIRYQPLQLQPRAENVLSTVLGCGYYPNLPFSGPLVFICQTTDNRFASGGEVWVNITQEFGELVGADVDGQGPLLVMESWGINGYQDGCQELYEDYRQRYGISETLERGQHVMVPVTLNDDDGFARGNCGAATVEVPAVDRIAVNTLNNPEQQAAVAVLGDVVLTTPFDGDVVLPNLQFISGSFELQNQPAEGGNKVVTMNAVSYVNRISLDSNPTLTSVSMTSLQYLLNTLTVTSNPALPTLDLDALEYASSVYFSDNDSMSCETIYDIVRDIFPERYCSSFYLYGGDGALCDSVPLDVCES